MNSNYPTQPRSDVIIAPCCFNEALFIERCGLKALLVRIKLSLHLFGYKYRVRNFMRVTGKADLNFLPELMTILSTDLNAFSKAYRELLCDLSGFKKGIYLVTIKSDDVSATKTIILE